MKRRLATLLLALALAAGLALPAGAAAEFQDVNDTDVRLSASQGAQAAERLHAMGLFAGVGTNPDGSPDFALERTPTRSEGIVMLVRLLGREASAHNTVSVMPFTDVPEWAAPYVNYAYYKGYTAGTSETTFGGGQALDAAQYLSLILRTMGYQDGTDFQWDSAWELSNRLGFTDYDPDRGGPFTRGTAAVWAWNALWALTEGGNRLADQLVSREGVTPAQAAAAGLLESKGGIALSNSYRVEDMADSYSGVLSVVGLPENAGDPGFIWTTSDPDVVELGRHSSPYLPESSARASIQERGVGTAVVTATSADGTMSASCTVEIINSSISLQIVGASGMMEGGGSSYDTWAEEELEFTCQVYPEDTTADRTMTWRLEEEDGSPAPASAAELEAAGDDSVRVLFHRAGSYRLVCETADASDAVRLEVEEDSPAYELRFSGGRQELEVGDSVILCLEQVKPEEKMPRVRVWENSDPEVASVAAVTNSGGYDAVVDGLSPGESTITAILEDGRTATTTVTVVADSGPMTLDLPSFPCTVEARDSAGELLYQVTFEDGSYRYDTWGLRLTLKGTVDYLSPNASGINVFFQIEDEDGDVVYDNVIALTVEEGPFTTTSTEFYPNLREGRHYTLELE